MKLSDIKNKIDLYFNEISADDLLRIMVSEYSFVQEDIVIEKDTFETISVNEYKKSNDSSSHFFYEEGSLPLAS